MRRLLLLFGLGLVALGPARAANPKLTLTVQNATLAQAVEALGRAAGVKLTAYQPGARPNAPEVAPAPATNEPRASFEWKGSTLARAMRDIAAQFHVRPGRTPDGYTFYPSTEPPPGPQRAIPAYNKAGIRVEPTSISISDFRTVQFENGGIGTSGNGGLSMSLRVELAEGDGAALAGFRNVSARDDLGNVLTRPEQEGGGGFYFGGGPSGQYPDEWRGHLSLPDVHPKATRLTWLEGDLMAYTRVRPFRVELPVPAPGKSVRRDVTPNLILHLSRFQAAAPAAQEEPEEEDQNLPVAVGRGRPAQPGPRVRVRVYVRRGEDGAIIAAEGSYRGSGLPPLAVNAAGKTFVSSQFDGASGSGNGEWFMTETTVMYPGMTDPPVRFVWDLVERGKPAKLCTFRITDIPLPDAGGLVLRQAPRRAAPPPVRPAAPSDAEEPPPHPFYQKGGGNLTTRVTLLDQVAPGGELRIGLAPREAMGWGPVRWTDIEVGSDGVARLPDVRPGRYRVMRTYRPTTPDPGKSGAQPAKPIPALQVGGRWVGGEVETTVTAARPVELPPLRWVKEGA